jgi:ribosomal protein S18 acetylase RimI-like enzyme
MLLLVGRHVPGATPLERDGLVGALVPTVGDYPWVSAAVLMPGAPRSALAGELPRCVWATEEHGAPPPGLHEHPDLAMPALGAELASLDAAPDPEVVDDVPLDAAGALNDVAYEQDGPLESVVGALPAERVHAHGLRDETGWTSVTLIIDHEGDASIQFVATAPHARRRGYAARVIRHGLDAAAGRGCTTTTLQASAQGLGVYERMGYRRVGLLRAWRPEPPEAEE